MPLLLLATVAALLWYEAGRRGWRVRPLVFPGAAALLGLILLAKGRPMIGGLIIAGALGWARSGRPRPSRTAAGPDDAWALAEARALLGVDPSADRAAIVAAHRRLMARNHPDVGGTEALARNLNAARDLLLQNRPT